MLKTEQMRCGIYDSQVSQRHKNRTPERITARFELELYHSTGGISHIDGQAYPVRRGMLLCARPGQKRYSQLPVRSSYLWVDPQGDTAWILEQLPVCTYIEEPEAVEALLTLFTELHRVMAGEMPEPENTVAQNKLVLEILQACLKLHRCSGRRSVQNRLVREIYRYIEDHFCEGCTLDDIAAHVHVSANHLHTVFVHSEGKTPYEYVTQKRIERAKTLILAGESTLAQIALETGFSSQSHFAAVFKKTTGQTPAQYRKQLFDLI